MTEKFRLSKNNNFFRSYNNWIQFLEPFNGMKRISPNTIIFLDHSTKEIIIELHGYRIIRQNCNNHFILDSFGWNTLTTKRRMNQFAPVSIYQKSYTWFLDNINTGKCYEFFDGIVVDMQGDILNG